MLSSGSDHPETEDAMAKTDFKSVSQYLATKPAAGRTELDRVRSIILKALPQADEVISYQIPAYKLQGRAVIYFAGWAQQYSLYPATEALVAAFESELAPYSVSKGTIRFPRRTTMKVMVFVKANDDSEAGKMPRGTVPGDGQLQRAAGKRWGHACGRRPAPELKGQARVVLGQAANRPGWTLHGDEGADRRVLAVGGEVHRRRRRVDPAFALPGR